MRQGRDRGQLGWSEGHLIRVNKKKLLNWTLGDLGSYYNRSCFKPKLEKVAKRMKQEAGEEASPSQFNNKSSAHTHLELGIILGSELM